MKKGTNCSVRSSFRTSITGSTSTFATHRHAPANIEDGSAHRRKHCPFLAIHGPRMPAPGRTGASITRGRELCVAGVPRCEVCVLIGSRTAALRGSFPQPYHIAHWR
jgi:hypothetical protein